MNSMSFVVSTVVLGLVVAIVGCESTQDRNYADAKARMARPIDCSTAEADIRILESEKVHVANQIATGVTSITPIGLVAGLATGKEGEKLEISSGKYNQLIDEKIAQIKEHCGLR